MRLRRRALLAACAPWPALARGVVPGVVSLDLLLTECLLSLGVRPAALANIPLYERLVAQPPVPPGVPDLGPAQEPHLEFLQALGPELILAPSWQKPALERLEQIAPVAWLPVFAPDGKPLEHAGALLLRIGALLGREAEARHQVALLRPAMVAAAARLADWSGRPVLAARFLEDGRHMAVFGGRSMVGAVVGQVGLHNAWAGRVNAAGVASSGIEALAGMTEATIVHFDRGAETARALARLEASPFWQALPAVREGRVLAMPVIYPGGGVFSAMRFASQLVAALEGRRPHG